MDHGPATHGSAEPSTSAVALPRRGSSSRLAGIGVLAPVGAGREGASPRAGRCWSCWPCRRLCRSGWSGPTRRSRTRPTYLWAGHLEWAHWLHGTPLPPFPAYFSGAPVIYPPLGALADSVGGLAGARILSLVFMLGATALLWATTEPALRAPGRVLRRRAVRRPRPDPAPGRVRHLRRHVAVPDRAGRLVRGPGRGAGRTRPAGCSRPAPRWRWPTPPHTRRRCSTPS